MLELRSPLAPLPTPFTDDGSQISEVRFVKLLRRMMESSVGGFVVGGLMSERNALSWTERKTCAELALRESRGDYTVVVDASTVNTAGSVDLAQHAGRHGAAAVLISPPYYGEFTEEEHVQHIRAVALYAGISHLVIDPREALSPESWDRLLGLDRVARVEPLPGLKLSSSCWRVGEVECRPDLVFRGHNFTGSVDGLCEAMESFGYARSAKAGLGALGLEMGDPRPPMRPLTLEKERELAELLGVE